LVAVTVLVGAVLTACSGSFGPPLDPDDPASGVPARTSWTLSHRVVESDAIRITGGSMGHYDESTSLSVGRDGNGQDENGQDQRCSVSMSAEGQGGPDMEVGDKVATTVQGRPGFRSGAGAERPYLMWQHDGRRWTQVSCPEERFLDDVARAVQFRPSSLALPFGLSPLPTGYGLSQVISDSEQGSHAVYLGKVVAAFGHAESDIVVSYETGALRVTSPVGRATTVKGRPAVLNEDREAPGVCIAEQSRYVCGGAYVTDTGPYPDRTGEIPTLLRIAEGLRFAPDLGERATWLESRDALPQ
jgi:hypothetical protein